jgi:hypothetical protein
MRYYLFLEKEHPMLAYEHAGERIADLLRHPLIGVYDDLDTMIAVFDEEAAKAHERIRRNGNPFSTPKELRRRMAPMRIARRRRRFCRRSIAIAI